jgi:hypothetical protein
MKLVKLILVILMFTLPAFAELTEAELKAMGKSSANSLGKELQQNYSDPKDAKNKLANPLVSETKMNTLSDSWKCPDNGKTFLSTLDCNDACDSNCVKNDFTATIQCASSEEALTISPAGFGTGGEVTLKVAFDTDLDGTKDQIFTTSNISGFCTNGYVSCTPGTWNNCKYYEFGVKHKNESGDVFNTYRECSATGVCTPADNKVTATARSVTEMRHTGGCYCTNASCGSSFNATFQQSLGAFGGGITAHLMNELGLVISDTKIDTATLSIKYLAASATSCLTAENNVSELKRHYQTGNIPADEELLNQMSDSDSNYNTIMESWGKTSESKQCVIRNTPVVTTGSIDEYWCTPGDVTTKVIMRDGYSSRQLTQHYQCIDKDGDGRGDTMRYLLDCALQGSGYDRCNQSSSSGWHEVSFKAYSGGEQNSGASVQIDWGTSAGWGAAELLYKITCSESVCRLDHWVNAYRYGTANDAATTTILPTVKQETLSVSRTDTCLALENDKDCKLYEEEINGIDTVQNYNANGILVHDTCKETSSDVGRYVICDSGQGFSVNGLSKSFITNDGVQRYSDPTIYSISNRNDGKERFEIKRTYNCETGKQHDFSSAKAQADTIGGSLNPDTGDFDYLVDGSKTSGNVWIDKDPYDSCTYSCVVKTGDKDTEVFPDQTTRRITADVVTEERPCGVDRNTMQHTCPIDNLTETLIKDCACTNAFNQVIAGFGVVSDAVKDMICSGN